MGGKMIRDFHLQTITKGEGGEMSTCIAGSKKIVW